MSHFEYMEILMRWFPQDIINQYIIMYLVDKDSFCLCRYPQVHVQSQTISLCCF